MAQSITDEERELLNAADDEPSGAAVEHPFLAKVRLQVARDFKDACDFCDGWHEKCADMYAAYHNAQDYTSLRKDHKFPVPFMQKTVDQIVSTLKDKLFFGAGSPCRIVGREKQDNQDAVAKDNMMRYQDERNGIRRLMSAWLRSVALDRVCVAQVDYVEKKRPVWEKVPVYKMLMDPNTGMPIVDDRGIPIPEMDMNGQPVVIGERWERSEQTDYLGAWCKKIDPQNLFITQDKREIDDPFPVMVQSFHDKRHFYDEEYYFNQDQIGKQEGQGSPTSEDPAIKKMRQRGFRAEDTSARRSHHLIEWQAPVNKRELYDWMAETGRGIEVHTPGRLYIDTEADEMIEVEGPRDTCWAIVGVVDALAVVRCDPTPFGIDGPNLVVGVITAEDEGVTGVGLAERIEAVHYGQQELMGWWLENFKQCVNSGWGVDKTKWCDENPSVNTPGGVFQFMGNPREAMVRMGPDMISPHILEGMEHLEQMGQDSVSTQDTISGKGDRATNTATETTAAFQQAMLNISEYLENLEATFIIPVWQLRNEINAALIDEEYAYRVLGKKGREWRKISPHAIKADVDFVCEGSRREAQKAVLSQQVIEVAKVAPLCVSAGQPVRIDKLIGKLLKGGFSWPDDQVAEIFPLIAAEEEAGGESQLNKLLAENAVLSQAVQRMQMLMMGGAQSGAPGPAMPGGGGPLPESTTEAEAEGAMMQRSSPNASSVM